MSTACSVVDEAIIRNQEAALRASTETFKSICGLDLALVEDAGVPKDADRSIIAVIALTGQKAWALVVGLPECTSGAVAQKFAGFVIPFDSSDMGDAIGEVANIIAGTTKAYLEQSGVKVDIGLPSVMRCQGVEMLRFKETSVKRWDFGSAAGPLWVELVSG